MKGEKRERETYTQTERQIQTERLRDHLGFLDFSLLLHTADDQNGWGWNRPKLGARNYTWISQISDRSSLGSSSTALPGTLELDKK